MTTKFEEFFQRIFCINLDGSTGREGEPQNSGPDRWVECQKQFAKYNLTTVERFSACNWKEEYFAKYGWEANAIWGCATSHIRLFNKILDENISRALILEDDFLILHDDFHQRFNLMIDMVPADWDYIYLGGQYGEPPIRRVNDHVIQNAGMMTTSSYAITNKMAHVLVHGDEKNPIPPGIAQPIDSAMYYYHQNYKSYIFTPRLMAQRDCFSIIQGRNMNNIPCMTDRRHEESI